MRRVAPGGGSGAPAGRVDRSVPVCPEAHTSLAQGLYYVTTGVWPLLSMRSFQSVTGPKTDLWLVKTVGVLVVVIGAVLAVAGLRGRPGPEIRLLGLGSALGLATIDVVYALHRRISSIYLLDALAEVGIALWWIPSRGEGGPEDELHDGLGSS